MAFDLGLWELEEVVQELHYLIVVVLIFSPFELYIASVNQVVLIFKSVVDSHYFLGETQVGLRLLRKRVFFQKVRQQLLSQKFVYESEVFRAKTIFLSKEENVTDDIL